MPSRRRIFSVVLAALVALVAGASSGQLDRIDIPGLDAITGQADGNGNGKPVAGIDRSEDPENCRTPKGVVDIAISKTKYPLSLQHIEEAIDAGWPDVWVINRVGADERRERLLRDIPTKDGFDRDEIPPAFSRGFGPGLEKGSDPVGWKAHVKYVPSSDNRGAGASIGIKARAYCSGTKFRVIGF